MDTSETYIKMCEKAKKILPEHKYETGDWYSTVFHDGVFLVQDLDAWADVPLYLRHPSECFPVYRQDQLQEMVGIRTPEDFERFHQSFSFPWEGEFGIPDYMGVCTSMEQLWLAFVMKEKYGKTWDGEDWVGA